MSSTYNCVDRNYFFWDLFKLTLIGKLRRVKKSFHVLMCIVHKITILCFTWFITGTLVPPPCPNGTYTYDNATGLQSELECLPCETSFYCRSGQLSELCAAGYYCKSGAKSDIPSVTVNFTACAANEECAGLCPAGYYCEEGTLTPAPCPETTFRNTTGAEQVGDCDFCPAGYMCDNGEHSFTMLDIQSIFLVVFKFQKICHVAIIAFL